MVRIFSAGVGVAVLALGCLASAAVAEEAAAPAGGFYVEAMLGGPLPLEQEFHANSIGSGSYDPEWGIGAWLSVGKHLTPRLRAQVGTAWIRGFDGEKTVAGTTFDYDGKDDMYVVMASLFYSLDRWGSVQPYVGAGFGAAFYDIKENGGPFVTHHEDVAPVVAGHLGFDYPLTSRISLTSRYSLAWVGEASFPTIIPGDKVVRESDFEHMFLTGLRFELN